MKNLEVIVSKLELRDLNSAYDFLINIFGNDYISKNELKSIFEKSRINDLSSSYIAKLNDDIVGFIAGYFPNVINARDNAYVKLIAVDENFRCNGIGTRLYDNLIASFKIIDTKEVIVSVWNESPENSSYNFFSHKGFIDVKRYDLYWYDSSIKDKWDCIRCGNPCMCSSTKMHLKM